MPAPIAFTTDELRLLLSIAAQIATRGSYFIEATEATRQTAFGAQVKISAELSAAHGEAKAPASSLAENEFQHVLSSLIGKYDESHREDVSEGDYEVRADAWTREFEEFLMDTTPDQSKRAFALLTLHIKNSNAND